MTEQEKQWFDALTEDRSESARTLEKPSMRGVHRDELANAKDAKALSGRYFANSSPPIGGVSYS